MHHPFAFFLANGWETSNLNRPNLISYAAHPSSQFWAPKPGAFTPQIPHLHTYAYSSYIYTSVAAAMRAALSISPAKAAGSVNSSYEVSKTYRNPRTCSAFPGLQSERI